jgi:hypothetical protein
MTAASSSVLVVALLALVGRVAASFSIAHG